MQANYLGCALFFNKATPISYYTNGCKLQCFHKAQMIRACYQESIILVASVTYPFGVIYCVASRHEVGQR